MASARQIDLEKAVFPVDLVLLVPSELQVIEMLDFLREVHHRPLGSAVKCSPFSIGRVVLEDFEYSGASGFYDALESFQATPGLQFYSLARRDDEPWDSVFSESVSKTKKTLSRWMAIATGVQVEAQHDPSHGSYRVKSTLPSKALLAALCSSLMFSNAWLSWISKFTSESVQN